MNTHKVRDEALTGSADPKKVFGACKFSITHSGPALVLYVEREATDQQIQAGAVVTPEEDGRQHLCGWLFGIGDHQLYPAEAMPSSRWKVLEVDVDDLTHLDGGVAFKRGYVMHTGDKLSATRYLEEHAPGVRSAPVIGAYRQTGNQQSIQVGAYGHAVSGDSGRACAGDYGSAAAGVRGEAVAGESGFASVGDRGTARVGDFGEAHAGEFGTATAGHGGTATAKDGGTAQVGDAGSASTGDFGNAQAGEKGIACAGQHGTASAGERGEIRLRYWDAQAARARTVIGYIGENGLQANTPYKLDANHQFAQVERTQGAGE